MISCWLFGVSREKMRRTLAPGIEGEGGGCGCGCGLVHIFQVAAAMAMTTTRVTITVSETARACGKIGSEFDGGMEGVGEMWLVLECG